MTPQEQLKDIDKKIIFTQIVDTPGTILLGLGLYAKFKANGDPLFEFMKEDNIVLSMIVIGAAIVFWGMYQTIALAKKKTELRKRYGL